MMSAGYGSVLGTNTLANTGYDLMYVYLITLFISLALVLTTYIFHKINKK